MDEIGFSDPSTGNLIVPRCFTVKSLYEDYLKLRENDEILKK